MVVNQRAGERLSTRIEHISQRPARTTPVALSTKLGGRIDTRTDADGNERPVETIYQASAAVHDPQGQLLIGATGWARIRAGRRTVGQRLWRYVCQTVRFEM